MQKAQAKLLGLSVMGPRRRPTLPHKRSCSTIGAEELNDRVRDGIGCDLFAMTTENSVGDLIKVTQRILYLSQQEQYSSVLRHPQRS